MASPRVDGQFSGAPSGGGGEESMDGDGERVCGWAEKIPREWAASARRRVESEIGTRTEQTNGLDCVPGGRFGLPLHGCSARDGYDSGFRSEVGLDHAEDTRGLET